MSGNNTDNGHDREILFHNGTAPIVITGGAGFIGSHLVDAVLRWFPAARVTVVDAFTYAANPKNLREAFETGRVSIIHGSVQDTALMERSIEPGATIFHLAAETHIPRSFSDPDLFDRVNRGGTKSVLNAALAKGARQVVHFSTAEVYGSRLIAADEHMPLAPTTPYALSKVNAEFEVARARDQGLNISVLRPGNVVGLRQHSEKLLPTFIRQALSGKYFTIEGSGRQLRTFLNVVDLTDAVGLVLRRGDPNGTYNIDGTETFRVLDVASSVAEIANCPCHCHHVPDRKINDEAYMLDGSRMAALGFRPATPLHQTIADMIKTEIQTGLAPAPPMAPNLPMATEDIALTEIETEEGRLPRNVSPR